MEKARGSCGGAADAGAGQAVDADLTGLTAIAAAGVGLSHGIYSG